MKSFRIFLPFVATRIFVLLAVFVSANAFAQQKASLASKKVFVSVDTKEDGAEDVKEELVRRLVDWDYWKVTPTKKEADLILKLHLQTYRGVTAWSWGGLTVKASVKLEDASGKSLWKSGEYKSSPNGTNGFNATRKTIGRIIKEMQKQFK